MLSLFSSDLELNMDAYVDRTASKKRVVKHFYFMLLYFDLDERWYEGMVGVSLIMHQQNKQ